MLAIEVERKTPEQARRTLRGRRAARPLRCRPRQRADEQKQRQCERSRSSAPRLSHRMRPGTGADRVGAGYAWRGASAPSSTKAACSARTASSVYFSSITTEILISLVLMSWMLMPSRASTANILAATPA